MKTITVIAVAARPPAWLAAAEAEYAARLVRFRVQMQTVRPNTPSKTAAAVRAKMPPQAPFYLLDAGGKQMDSAAFARWLAARLEEPRAPVFIIGGADGLPAPLPPAAGTISLSPLTFAHGIARLVLAEQLFRADCIMRGHPYPR